MQAEIKLVECHIAQRVATSVAISLIGAGWYSNVCRTEIAIQCGSGFDPFAGWIDRITRHIGALNKKRAELIRSRWAISQIDWLTAGIRIDGGKLPAADCRIQRTIHVVAEVTSGAYRQIPHHAKGLIDRLIVSGLANLPGEVCKIDARVIAVGSVKMSRGVVDCMRPRKGVQHVETAGEAML